MKAPIATGIAAMLLLAGCESTQQAAAPAPATRFLPPQTAALLRPSDAGSRLYINQNLDFRRHTRVMVEPVQLWLAPNHTRLNAEQRQIVANTVYSALREELGRDLQIVDRPGLGTLLAAAIDSRDATAGARVRTSSWDDVQTVARYWAAQTSYRLCKVPRRTNCLEPA